MALLTEEALYSGDALHISSTDLRSWTTTTLPLKHFSMTTYQSKFVLVGGRHPATGLPTNQLLTSASGQDWLPSLPPMPTKRDSTTAISTKSPDEVLVVACGLGFPLGTHLNMVEVLLENQWSTVDPLPIPATSDVQSALHNGNFYFLGEGYEHYLLYTSSCASLISACKYVREHGHTGQGRQFGQLWKQLEVHDNDVYLTSYSSRLVCVSRKCTIFAYCTTSRSWIEPSRDQISAESSGYVAAEVLSSGELVIAHEHGGIHRVKLSGKRFVT